MNDPGYGRAAGRERGGGSNAPADVEGRLSSLYDAALALFAREGRWRAALAEQIAIEPHDTILDIGCGAGALCLMLARLQPRAEIIGLDHRPAFVAQARARAAEVGLKVSFMEGDAREAGLYIGQRTPTKIVLTLAGARSVEKLAQLQGARQVIDPAGTLHVADYGAQRTALMQRLFASTSPRGIDDAALLIRAAGFVAVEETAAWPTPSGVIALHRARAS